MRQNLTCQELRAAPLEVTIVGGSVGGGLTNVELRATPVAVSGTVTANVGTVPVTGTFFQATQPVSGTFFQATQPVSIAATVAISAAALPLPSGAATETTLAALGAKTPALGQAAMAASSPVVIASNQSAVPVSGTVTANINGTVPVSGTFFQATQPVSLAALPALAAGTNLIGRVQDQYAARVVRNFILDTFTAAPVADALQSVAQWYGNAAVGATTTPAAVPAAKILKLTSWGIETKSLATVGSVVVRVRANTGGTVVIGSPIAGSFSAGSIAGATTTAMTGAFCGLTGDFGEGGLEFPAGTGIGFSMAGYGPTGTLTLEGVTRFWVYGYEYTA